MQGIQAVGLSLLLAFFLHPSLCCADDGKSLSVRIVAEYEPPSCSSIAPPSYRAASALTLSCVVDGVQDYTGLTYHWSSTCTGNCFTQGETTANVSTPYLHSYDTGVHTCMVYDVLGCTGSANTTVNVVGAGIYVSGQVLANNSLITTLAQNRIPLFRCLSGSATPNIGNLVNSNGSDITHSRNDPFNVVQGRSHDPGTLLVLSARALAPEEDGIYTYRTPDENGDIAEFHFGLYRSSTAIPPYCPGIEHSFSDSGLTLSCPSYHSPPTEVIWERDGVRIHCNDAGYQFNQRMLDRSTSAYNNTLSTNATVEDVIGEYCCTVNNTLGSSGTFCTEVEALEVHGYETPVIVGLSRSINCSTQLEVTRMEWIVVAVGNAVEVDEDGGQSLVLPLSPTTTGLDGAEFTCRITTARGRTFSRTITVAVKELTHVVDVSGAPNPLMAGGKYSLTCTITSDFPTHVQWVGPDNQEVDESDVSVRVLAPVTRGNTTTLVLHFDPIETSHGASYTCKSSSYELTSNRSATRHVKVQMTSDVSVTRSPNSTTLYTGGALALTCVTKVNEAVDTPLQVSHQWRGPGGVVSSGSGVTVVAVNGSGHEYSSTVTFTSLRSSHSGTYTCSSTVSPVESSVFIGSSAAQTGSTSFTAALNVTIEITYNSPDNYPLYSPPNYRTASSVSLRCVVTGATGRFRWTSTCSDCFARNSGSSSSHVSSHTISEPFLKARDAGVHTCTVTDALGSTGSSSTTMKIVGAGIYVSFSYGSAVGSGVGLQGPQPANSYAMVDTGSSSYTTRFQMYCCSNTSYPTGRFTYPDGRTSSNSHATYSSVTRHTRSTYAGCYEFKYSRSSYYGFSLSSSNIGIHTCRISDSRGVNQYVNIGIYSQGFNSRLSISSLTFSTSRSTSITLVCQTQGSPPSTIKWYRDNTLLDTSGNTTDMSVSVIERRTGSTPRYPSYYPRRPYAFSITLNICDSPGHILGRYRCEAGNRFGTARQYHTVQGLQQSCSPSGFTIGRSVTCTCSSDISASIQWYRESPSTSSRVGIGGRTITIPVTTDGHGDVYVCMMSSSCGNQENNVTVDVTVPDNWGSVSTSNSTGQNALHNTDYVLTCTVTTISGMNLVPSMEWVGPDGAVVRGEGNITIGEAVETQGTVYTLTLSFSPVVTTDGGRYTCRVNVSVPWMDTQPPLLSASVDMPVTTQAMFQLKMYPLRHCSTWDVAMAQDLEQSIQREVETAVRQRCDCDFSSTAIYSGEFSCQFTSCKSNECDLATHVTYRAILNGTSDLLTANQLMTHLQNWRETSGTLLYNVFRLRLVTQQCSISINSFDEQECET